MRTPSRRAGDGSRAQRVAQPGARRCAQSAEPRVSSFVSRRLRLARRMLCARFAREDNPMNQRMLARTGLVSYVAALAALGCAVSAEPDREAVRQSRAALSSAAAGGAPSFDSADLSIWGWSSDQTLVGQPTYAAFYGYNSGPASA